MRGIHAVVTGVFVVFWPSNLGTVRCCVEWSSLVCHLSPPSLDAPPRFSLYTSTTIREVNCRGVFQVWRPLRSPFVPPRPFMSWCNSGLGVKGKVLCTKRQCINCADFFAHRQPSHQIFPFFHPGADGCTPRGHQVRSTPRICCTSKIRTWIHVVGSTHTGEYSHLPVGARASPVFPPFPFPHRSRGRPLSASPHRRFRRMAGCHLAYPPAAQDDEPSDNSPERCAGASCDGSPSECHAICHTVWSPPPAPSGSVCLLCRPPVVPPFCDFLLNNLPWAGVRTGQGAFFFLLFFYAYKKVPPCKKQGSVKGQPGVRTWVWKIKYSEASKIHIFQKSPPRCG